MRLGAELPYQFRDVLQFACLLVLVKGLTQTFCESLDFHLQQNVVKHLQLGAVHVLDLIVQCGPQLLRRNDRR